MKYTTAQADLARLEQQKGQGQEIELSMSLIAKGRERETTSTTGYSVMKMRFARSADTHCRKKENSLNAGFKTKHTDPMDNIEIITDIIQGDEKWDRLRAVTPTASEFSKIITGGGKVSTQREAYMRRLSVNRKYPQPTFQGNQWTDRGHALEPEARKRLAKETKYEIRQVGLIRRKDCGAGGSPDGLIYSQDDPLGSAWGAKPVAGIEIKCFNVDKHLTILNSGELPTENKPQVHGHLWLSGLPAWLFVLYCPEAFPLDFRIIEVTPDGYTREVGNAVYQFCVDYQKNWQRYLAEYEVDQLGKSYEQMCPVTHRLAAPQAKQPTPIITESLI